MPDFPQLFTDRLVLRAFALTDGADVERLAGSREVADTTLTLPHPYPPGSSIEWIGRHADAWSRGERLTLGIYQRESEALLGAISLQFSMTHLHGELAYWIGAPSWGNGYATEAAMALTNFAFTDLRLHRVEGRHFIRNVASGRVMTKLGMQVEGIHRDAFRRWGRFESVAVYSVLAPEWMHRSAAQEQV
jgi:ribosomal-protein-alanine N-acetyltransferase